MVLPKEVNMEEKYLLSATMEKRMLKELQWAKTAQSFFVGLFVTKVALNTTSLRSINLLYVT